ncbi:MAG: ABC transporter permease subunit [Planctomycetes bacterium]|nr:ABC transporter permease subunit [Planctomycetota bacterium]
MRALTAILGPTLQKERLARVRAPGAMAWFMAYTGLLALGCAAIYFIENPQPTPTIGVGWNAGLPVFRSLVFLQAALILLVAPGLTCSVFSGEKESGTFDLLMTVPVDPTDLVMGKLLASLALLGLRVGASLPLAGLCLLLGGVEPWGVLGAYLALGLLALSTGLLGTWASAALQRTAAAGIAAYACESAVLAWGVLDGRFSSLRGSGFMSGYESIRGIVIAIGLAWVCWSVLRPALDHYHRAYDQAGCVFTVLMFLIVGLPLMLAVLGGLPHLLSALNPFLILDAVCGRGGANTGLFMVPAVGGDTGVLAAIGAFGHGGLAVFFAFRTRRAVRQMLTPEMEIAPARGDLFAGRPA